MQSYGQIVFNHPVNYGPPRTDKDRQAEPKDISPERKNPEQEAKIENDQETLKRQVASNQKINDLVHSLSVELFALTTVFPFKLFPTQIIIRPTKVDIIHASFFWSEDVHTTLISDISDVSVHTSIFFASLVITDQGYHDKVIQIRFLPRNSAVKARRIIQGLVIAFRENIDPEKIDPIELADKAEKLGKTRQV